VYSSTHHTHSAGERSPCDANALQSMTSASVFHPVAACNDRRVAASDAGAREYAPCSTRDVRTEVHVTSAQQVAHVHVPLHYGNDGNDGNAEAHVTAVQLYTRVHTCPASRTTATRSVPTNELSGATGDEYFRTNQHMMMRQRQQHKVPTLTRPREWHTDIQRSPMRWSDGHCAPLTHCEVVRIDRVVDRRRRGDCATSVESIAKGLHLGQCTHSLGVDLVGAWDGGREQRAIAAKCR
jgi:hypothetical protein